MSQVLPDQAARDRIRADLATNLIVEAGAGSGKTTALVGRLLQHVVNGTPVDQLAAVTFTRKAAEELRERFQLRLEEAVRTGTGNVAHDERCALALRELERAFLGTIHGFCARLLRERPIEVGLDPNFQEIPDTDVEPMNRAFWRNWIDRARRLGDADIQALYDCGVDPADLHDAFATVMRFHDVDFVSDAVAMPDAGSCVAALHALMVRADEARAGMPSGGKPDALMRLLDRLRFHRSVSDWADPVVACTLLDTLSEGQLKVVQKEWSDDTAGRKAAKALETDWIRFFSDVAGPVVRQWREYRYPVVMKVLRRAVSEFARERHADGTLGFDDLLLLSARLLREHPVVRNELGHRYRYLLVDEFQDTDPVQAEVCLLLSSDASEGSDWQTVTPRRGALFVVGDPKQSIYRFRRADIQIYERVKARFSVFGATLSLTANFRSTAAIGALVNRSFEHTLPATASAEQAAFSPLMPIRAAAHGPTAGVFRYVVECDSRRDEDLLEQDAAMVATWIAERIAGGETPGNFLVLTEQKRPIAKLARALAERNIPVSTTGALLTQEYELEELMLVLRALADPGNPVLVAAALEGLFFGLSPADLFAARQLGIAFSIASRPTGADHPVQRALDVLHGWWRFSRQHGADVLLERICDDTGLLALAAGSVLGDARGGALLHLVDAVRGSAGTGRSGLTDAIEVLNTLLEAEAPDAPLRPGRTDTVRVMNLHKAKGLEAEIVILAAPTDRKQYEPLVHVVRGAHDVATGGMMISTRDGATIRRIAQPVGWDAMQAAEVAFSSAEEDRLRYVATTRARRALVISQARKSGKVAKPDAAMWRPLADAVDPMAGAPLEIRVSPAAGRETLAADSSEMQAAADVAAARVRDASQSSLQIEIVTGVVKGDDADDEPVPRSGRAAGRVWGTAVHRCIDALARGRSKNSLHAFVRAVIDEAQLGESAYALMLQWLDDVERSPTWVAARAAGSLQSELAVMQVQQGAAGVVVTEGVIDLAANAPDGWRVVDWKSDDVDTAEWDRRRVRYDAQVARYAEMLQAISGEPARGVVERVGQP